MVMSYHEHMTSTACFNGGQPDSLTVSRGVKQERVLAPHLYGISSMLLPYSFNDCTEGIYVHIRSDGKLYNIARLRAKATVLEVLIRELLFADDAALTSHTEAGLQELVDRLSHACKEFGLTIRLNSCLKDTQYLPSICLFGSNFVWFRYVSNVTLWAKMYTPNSAFSGLRFDFTRIVKC